MGFKSVIASIFSKGASDLAGTAFNGLDGLITSKEELGAQEISLEEIKAMVANNKMEFSLAKKELEYKLKDQVFKDRNSARQMGMVDPWTPRILTIVFTLGYFAISGFMFSIVIKMFNQDMNDFVVSFISNIFGAYNAIMIQIISYYFGASKGGDDTGAAMAQSFKQAAPTVQDDEM